MKKVNLCVAEIADCAGRPRVHVLALAVTVGAEEGVAG